MQCDRATLLRHLSNGRLVSGTFPAGSFPVVTGGGEEVARYTLDMVSLDIYRD